MGTIPCTYLIDEENTIAELTSTGAVTKDEIIARMVRLFNDPQWCPGYQVLIDYAAADGHDINSEEFDVILKTVIQLKSKIGRSKFAVVVSTDLSYAFTRMWALKGGENILHMACFRPRNQAMDRLKVQLEIEA